MTQAIIQRSFASGELSPVLSARADLSQYLTGLRACWNFIVLRQGGVTKRPGTRYVATVKNPTQTPRLLRFVFEAADQTYLIEAGDQYFRFFWHGAPVLVAGVPYEVATPYIAGDVAGLNISQSADVLVITHPSYAPMELARVAHDSWTLTAINFAPWHAAPVALVATRGAAGILTLRYKVTALKADTFEETIGSSVAACASCAVPTVALPNTLAWTAVAGVEEYGVYLDPYNNGVFGYIGTAKSNSFRDVGYQPDYTVTPPIVRSLFAATGTYPKTCKHHQQRLWFAQSNTDRETVWGSQVGAYHNFAISTPLQDDDAVTFVVAGPYVSPPAHLLGLKNLIICSDVGAWRIKGDESGVITPTAINADQESYIGVHPGIRPVIIGNTIVYVQARGTVVRAQSFDQQQGGLGGIDLTPLAGHLFAGYKLSDIDFHLIPWAVLWAARDDGTMLGLTYLPEQNVLAWHRHSTGASGQPGCAELDPIETLCVLPDTVAGEDVLYMVVKRTINGSETRYIERLATAFDPEKTAIEDAYFVDCGLSYTGAPATTFSGLTHLNGMVVAILADGRVIYDGNPAGADAGLYTVSGGSITLPSAASVVHIGLAIRFAEIETLTLDVNGSSLRALKKKIQNIGAIVYGSDDGLLMGPDRDHLETWRREAQQPSESWRTGLLMSNLTCTYDEEGRAVVRHARPLPCTIVGLIPNVGVGG